MYFCCHEDDFDTYFESVCNEIFTCNDCSIWYCQNNEVDIAEYEDILKHLVVGKDDKVVVYPSIDSEHNICVAPVIKTIIISPAFSFCY